MPPSRSAALPLVLLAAALAGCGGGDAGSTATSASRVAPRTAPARPAPVYGTGRSAQQVADDQAATADPSNPVGELEPLPASAFRGPVRRYRRFTAVEARAMQRAATSLRAAIAADDRPAARRAWSRAYSRWLRIGAAYGALGDLDAAIDGAPGGLPHGTRDPHFVGLHRIELGLWTGEPLRRLRPVAARLGRDVHRLRRTVGSIAIPPLDYATRAHEILEDAERDGLTGRAAPWSGAGVAATADGLAATREVIGTLRPTLQARGDALGQVDAQLDRLGGELAAIRRAHRGRYPRLDDLRGAERQRLDGRLGGALEALSQVPEALETVRAPRVPPIPSR